MNLSILLVLFVSTAWAQQEWQHSDLGNLKGLKDYIKFDKIEQNLRDISSKPHIAGTDANLKVATTIANKWKDAGLENVHFKNYSALLSYPDFDNPNHVRIFDKDGNKVFASSGVSPPLIPNEQGDKNAGIQWLAYSGDGIVKGDPVYVHFGRQQDFDYVIKTKGISLKDKIALIRYGGAYRGNTVKLAGLNGALGAILFSDPFDVAELGGDADHTFPNTDYMPNQGVQLGAVKKGDGEPLSPFYPSKPELHFTRTVEDLKKEHVIPTIPVLPLGYADFYKILSQLDGEDAPKEWQGGLNVTYKLGPGLLNKQKLEVEVHSSIEKRQIQNVIGYLKGSKEPDRYVILSNHFDAWAYGSMDPNSGTAILAEIARAMVEAKKDGVFKPLRSIMFCNWDAEEYGVMGSNEFAEEFAHTLSQRAVALINVDLISGNGTLKLETVPTLYNLVLEASKNIENPMDSEKKANRSSIYDTWYHRLPGNNPFIHELPKIDSPNDGSDHATFMSYLGLPVIDFTYLRHNDNPNTNRTYPLYHTLYETPFSNHIFDTNNFAVHTAVGKFWAELARLIAERPILPLNVLTFARQLHRVYNDKLKVSVNDLHSKIPEAGVATEQIAHLLLDSKEFERVAEQFQMRIENLDLSKQSDLQLRDINDRIMNVERCFIMPNGVSDIAVQRNVLFSFANGNAYASAIMPGIYDKIDVLVKAATVEEKTKLSSELAERISHLQIAIQCATSTLLPDP